ncbi:MAG: LiaI-LiaF-like domain-containing protein [Candidatus Krumholzibacteriia bacterium]
MNILQHLRREERPGDSGPGAGPAPGAPPPPPPSWSTPPRQADGNLKSTVLAGVLSAIFPGLGQIYVGYYQRGATFALTMAAIITTLAGNLMHGLEPLLGIAIGFTWFLGIIDANRLANLYNQALQGRAGLGLPEGFQLPRERGSYAGGAVLIALGLLLFLNRNFDFSLEWLQDWWPLGVIGLGVWLIVKARQGRGPRAGA